MITIEKKSAVADNGGPVGSPKLSASVQMASLLGLAFFFLCLAHLPLLGEKDKSLEEAWEKLKPAELHFSQGLKEFKENRNESAFAAFQNCIQEMPRHAYARYYLANLYYIRGDYQRSLIHMQQSLDDFLFMQELGDYGGRLKRREIDSYQQMLATEWDSNTSCRARREIESLSDELSTKENRMELLAKKKRDAGSQQKAHYLYFLGNVLFQLKRFSEASQKYQEAIDLNPRHASAYNNAAAIYYLAGEHRAALAYLDRAEQQGLEDNLNLKLKHLVYEALGRPTEGILQEDLSLGAENDLGVMRFALAFDNKEATLPPLYENGYVVFSRKSKQAVLIDPGVPDSRIRDFVQRQNLGVKAVLNTHGHEDHTAADAHFSGLFGAPVLVHKKDAKGFAAPPDRYIEDGETFSYDGFAVRVLHTPGHTAGSVCFLIGDFLFSGDTLFKNDIGKVWTDDPHRIQKAQGALVQHIKDKLMVLPGQTWVCPGHGKTSTIADEKANNPFLR